MRVVVDSNVLLVAIGRRSSYRPIWQAFLKGHYELVISEGIINEYEEILQQYAAPGASDVVMEILSVSPGIIYQHVFYNWNVIRADEDDNKFFDVAVSGNADYLVTNDAHFNVATQLTFPKVNIISASNYLALVAKLD